jgi:hypothetical protein
VHSCSHFFVAGKELRPGASDKEVELLLFDEGILADRRVWNACEELELEVLMTDFRPAFLIPYPESNSNYLS